MKYSKLYDLAGIITCNTLIDDMVTTNTSLEAITFKGVLYLLLFYFVIHLYIPSKNNSDDD